MLSFLKTKRAARAAKKITAALAAAILLTLTSVPVVSAYAEGESDYAKYRDYYAVSKPVDEETLQYFESLYPGLDELIDYYTQYSLYELTREQAIKAMVSKFLTSNPYLVPYMANSLLTIFDPFGGYYSGSSVDALFSDNSYYGFGVIIDGKKISNANKYNIVIARVIKNSPADRAGVKAGDEFVKIADIEVEDYGMALISDLLSSLEGDADFVFRRDGKEINVTMAKDRVTYETISYEIIDEAEKSALITIADFIEENIVGDLRNALGKLHTEGYKNLIIDLRDNGGGNIEYLYETLNLFVEEKDVLLGTLELRGDEKQDIESSGEGFKFDNFCILTNGSTASAAEAFALTLSELTGGIIIGETTYGKGIGQSYVEMENGYIAGMTTLELVSPKGTKYHEIGVAPHIKIGHRLENFEKNDFSQLNFVNCVSIKKDADNAAVLALSQRLARMGYIMPEKVSSKCTREIITAVEIFQERCGLPVGIDKIDYMFLEYLNYYTNYAPTAAIDGDAQLDCAKIYISEGEQAARDFAENK